MSICGKIYPICTFFSLKRFLFTFFVMPNHELLDKSTFFMMQMMKNVKGFHYDYTKAKFRMQYILIEWNIRNKEE